MSTRRFPSIPGRLNWLRVRELGAYSFYLILNTAGDYLRFYADSIVIARVISISLVTPFAVAGRLMEYFKVDHIWAGGPAGTQHE